MGYNIKPSIGMMPMEDIENVLEEEGFIKDLKAADIEKVTATKSIKNDAIVTVPGINDPSRIAICASGAANGTIDRETVKNALNLGGKPASKYLSDTDKEYYDSINQNIIKSYAGEVQLLRDELYHLKDILIKSGHIESTDVAKGYIDSFKGINKKYSTGTAIINSATDTGIKVSNYSLFNEGDWVIVQTNPNNEETVIDDTIKSKSSTELVLENNIQNISYNNSIITKCIGGYKNGTFSFSKVTKDAVGNKERYTSLNDDVTLKESMITKPNTGFATTIRIPNRHSGFLTKFIAQGKTVGNPGILVCYVLKLTHQQIENLSATKDLTEYINQELYIAKSLPVSTYEKESHEIVFNFENSDINSKYLYPEVEGGKEYAFIIECYNADEDNYWNLEFGNNNSKDLQTNNFSYKFTRSLTSTIGEKELVSFDDNRDLFYTVVTRSKEDELEIPYKYGLYTTNTDIRLSEPIKANRIRVTLEINKEGNLITTTTGLIKANRDYIYFNNVDGTSYGQLIMNIGDTAVIGDNIVKITAATSNSVMIDKSIYIDKPMPIYRAAYDVKIKAKFVQPDTETYKDKVMQQKTYVLVLKSVILNNRNNLSPISDRLVYEIDEADDLKYFNRAELQVKWHSNLTTEILKTQLEKYNDCVGRINSLCVTFDEKI